MVVVVVVIVLVVNVLPVLPSDVDVLLPLEQLVLLLVAPPLLVYHPFRKGARTPSYVVFLLVLYMQDTLLYWPRENPWPLSGLV
jgi:hypothetical protein